MKDIEKPEIISLYDASGQRYGTVFRDSDGKETIHPDHPARRDVKDRLFKFIFGNPDRKEWTLSLYNAIEHTDYTDINDLEIVTLENAIYMHMKNDVGVLVGLWNLVFWEHQSTLSPNIPYRMVGYYSATMEKYIASKHLNTYSTKSMKLPAPKFYVFYNGKQKAPEISTLKLSDLYYNNSEEPMLELKVKQYNINGYPDEPGGCRQLYEYQWFIEKIREYTKQTDITEAVSRAMDEIPEDFTIRDMLAENRSEVLKMSIFEYNEAEHMAMEREEWFEEGLEKGRAEGRAEGAAAAKAEIIQRVMDSSQISFEEACSLLKLTDEETDSCRKALLDDSDSSGTDRADIRN